MFPVWKEIFTITAPKITRENTHRGEATPLLPVWKEIYPVGEPEKA
jgi:hypothetical protein